MLFFGLVLGVVFISLVPPWQHYDEPTHFEYTWLIANRPGLPAEGEYDQAMRREAAASMIEHEFFRGMGFTPNLLSSAEPIWLGISQTGSSPLYYWLASIPLRALRTADVTFQLVVLRFVSTLFFLATILAAYGVAVELSPKKHPLRWLLPATILLLPSFVDILTAVNDDVGATAFFSLFLWSGIRLINRGYHWFRFLITLVLAVICFYTKNTVMIALLLVAIPLVFSIVRGEKRRYVWISMAGVAVLVVLSLFSWGDPANWYKLTSSSSATRSTNPESPLGKIVFEFKLSPEKGKAQISQLMPTGLSQRENSVITLGAWIWADKPATVQTPILRAAGQSIVKQVEVNEEPRFFSVSEKIGSNDSQINITLSPVDKPVDESLTVYYDGIVVVEGSWPGDTPPIFTDSTGREGVWGGEEFLNLVRNPSAEIAGPQIRGWVEAVITSRFPGNPTLILGLLFDPTPITSYYTATIKSLFQTFWARFGWAHVVLRGFHPYTILGIFTLLGLTGALAAFWRKRREIRWDVFLFLGLALIVIWGAAFLRGLTSVLEGSNFIPVARYAYPVIIPTMLILNIGWLEVIRWIEKYLNIPQKVLLGLLILYFILLDILSVYSIYQYYNQ